MYRRHTFSVYVVCTTRRTCQPGRMGEDDQTPGLRSYAFFLFCPTFLLREGPGIPFLRVCFLNFCIDRAIRSTDKFRRSLCVLCVCVVCRCCRSLSLISSTCLARGHTPHSASVTVHRSLRCGWCGTEDLRSWTHFVEVCGRDVLSVCCVDYFCRGKGCSFGCRQ